MREQRNEESSMLLIAVASGFPPTTQI